MKGKILSNEYIFAGNSAYFKYEKNDFLGDFTLKIGDFVYFIPERNIARKICPFALKDKFYKSTEVDDSDVKKAKIFGILSSFMLIANAIFNENIFITLGIWIIYILLFYLAVSAIKDANMLKDKSVEFFKKSFFAYMIGILISFVPLIGIISIVFLLMAHYFMFLVYKEISNESGENSFFIAGFLYLASYILMVASIFSQKLIIFSGICAILFTLFSTIAWFKLKEIKKEL